MTTPHELMNITGRPSELGAALAKQRIDGKALLDSGHPPPMPRTSPVTHEEMMVVRAIDAQRARGK